MVGFCGVREGEVVWLDLVHEKPGRRGREGFGEVGEIVEEGVGSVPYVLSNRQVAGEVERVEVRIGVPLWEVD